MALTTKHIKGEASVEGATLASYNGEGVIVGVYANSEDRVKLQVDGSIIEGIGTYDEREIYLNYAESHLPGQAIALYGEDGVKYLNIPFSSSVKITKSYGDDTTRIILALVVKV